MRKSGLLLAVFLALASCKKETPVAENTDYPTDSVTIPETNEPTAEIQPIVQSPEDLKQILAPANEDTLYVTNFFATWCGPCIRELPHFRNQMEKLKGQPVKFTFISLDDPADWDTKVKNFANEHGIAEQTVLVDGAKLNSDFFGNFKEWKGESIPFTIIRRGKSSEETVGMMSPQALEAQITAMLPQKTP